MNKLYVIGIGPGEYEGLTIKADNALKECDVIIGYTVYAELVKKYYPDKTFIVTSMKQEMQRCRIAYEQAAMGKKTAMVCSGDAGVYGMAGIMYELNKDYTNVELEIIPGVTAALSGSSVLGAPLSHDFAVISLSDLLTPWELIAKRIECAAMSDMCMSIYNPSSKKRHDYLHRACEIILKYKNEDTVCGYVKNIGRDGEEYKIMTLKELSYEPTDMFTTVFIGNKDTKVINGKMITPRGYKNISL